VEDEAWSDIGGRSWPAGRIIQSALLCETSHVYVLSHPLADSDDVAPAQT
jgi:hypothetical protein